MQDPSKMERIPVGYQELSDYFNGLSSSGGTVQPALWRQETFRRIEKITGRPLICYVTKTYNLPPGIVVSIDDGDMIGFGDLTHSISGDEVDVFIVSNGGAPEAAERIVQLLRGRFKSVRFIVPSNAYSAATLICFSGDEIIMDSMGTLGPIDPQLNGIPARAILRSFETLEERMKVEGPRALTAYMPLISKYDLHILEICKSAQELSKELAANWLSAYMLKCAIDDPTVSSIVEFFSNYDTHKSHGRSINRAKAEELKLKVRTVEEVPGLPDLIRSLYNQYVWWFDVTPFIKMFENTHGVNWGRQIQTLQIQIPNPTPLPVPPPQPAP